MLGRGAFGEVIRGLHLETEKSYAIKMLDAKTLKPGNIRGEVKILKELRHPNVIHLREIFATEEYVYLVMEYAKGGALVDVVVKDGKLSESFTAACVMQVASALEFMHANGVVHRDIKPENVLVSYIKTRLVKVCDFGLKIFNGFRTPLLSGKGGSAATAVKVDSKRTALHGTSDQQRLGAEMSPGNSGVASPHTYSLNDRSLVMVASARSSTSPEVITGQATYDHSVDLWGLGLIMHILITGKHPFADAIDWYGSLVAGKVDCDAPVWSQISPSATDLVRALLRAKPADRITAREVLDHPWMVDGMSNNRRLEQSLAYLNVFPTAGPRRRDEGAADHRAGDVRDPSHLRLPRRGARLPDACDLRRLADKAHKQLGRASIDLLPTRAQYPAAPAQTPPDDAIRKQQVITFEMFLARCSRQRRLVHEPCCVPSSSSTRLARALSTRTTCRRRAGLRPRRGRHGPGAHDARRRGERTKKLSYDAFVDILLRSATSCKTSSEISPLGIRALRRAAVGSRRHRSDWRFHRRGQCRAAGLAVPSASESSRERR